MNIFRRLFKSAPAPKEKVLNAGLALAMEFGSNWLKPTTDRLQTKFTSFTMYKLEEYNTICKTVMNEGTQFVYNMLDKLADEGDTITNKELQEQFRGHMKSLYDWIDETNLRKLYSQGCYYAWKEGLDRIIVN